MLTNKLSLFIGLALVVLGMVACAPTIRVDMQPRKGSELYQQKGVPGYGVPGAASGTGAPPSIASCVISDAVTYNTFHLTTADEGPWKMKIQDFYFELKRTAETTWVLTVNGPGGKAQSHKIEGIDQFYLLNNAFLVNCETMTALP